MNLDVYSSLLSVSISSAVSYAWASPTPALGHISTTSQHRKRVSSLPDPLKTLKNNSDPTCGQCYPYQKVEEALPAGNINIHNAYNINF